MDEIKECELRLEELKESLFEIKGKLNEEDYKKLIHDIKIELSKESKGGKMT